MKFDRINIQNDTISKNGDLSICFIDFHFILLTEIYHQKFFTKKSIFK